MLGLQLGRLPSELGDMTAAEETLLMAYYRDDPWGDHRADIRAGQVAQILWNSNAKKSKKLTDFLPFYRKPTPKEDPNIDTSILSAFSQLMGKK